MGFNFTESKQSERKMWTGVMPVEITHINPTHAELKGIYGDQAAAPSYITTENGVRKVRLDFYVKNDQYNFKDKFVIFMEDKPRVSTKGNTQVINNRAQSTWVQDPNNVTYEWFDKTGVRAAKDGEVTLYDMLVALINADRNSKDTNLVLENFNSLFDGDVSELRALNEKYGKGLKVLLGVKDGKYQDIYTGYFGRTSIKSNTYIMRAATDADYPWTRDFGNSDEVKEYTAPATPDAVESVASNDEIKSAGLY